MIILTNLLTPSKLLARIQALPRRVTLERANLADSIELAVGPLRLDRQARRAWLGDNELALKPKTFSVLAYIMLHAGEVLTRERLLSAVWGWETQSESRTVDVRIAELRKQLQDDPNDPRFIETVSGAGYRFLVIGEFIDPAKKPTLSSELFLGDSPLFPHFYRPSPLVDA